MILPVKMNKMDGQSRMLKGRKVAISALTSVSIALPSIAGLAEAEVPLWWYSRGVFDTGAARNDNAVASIGQAKWMATQALTELQQVAPELATTIDLSLLFQSPPEGRDAAWYERQKSPLNLGQLKAISKPFYDALPSSWLEGQARQNGVELLSARYPWNEETLIDVNFKPATVGQLKAVFSLRFRQDSDNSGAGDMLPDLWEIVHFGDLAQIGEGDHDRDGRSNIEEYRGQSNPVNSADGDPSVIDTDSDGVVDAKDADPKDSAVKWLPVREGSYAVIDIGVPATADETKQWDYYLGEKGHVLMSWEDTGSVPESGPKDENDFQTYVWDPSTSVWSSALQQPDNIRARGRAIDKGGNVYGRGYAALGVDQSAPGMKEVAVVWNRTATSWSAAQAEFAEGIGAGFSNVSDTWTLIPSRLSLGNTSIFGDSGRFAVKDSASGDSSALYALGGSEVVKIVESNSSDQLDENNCVTVGDALGWNLVQWNGGYSFTRLVESGAILEKNVPPSIEPSHEARIAGIGVEMYASNEVDVVTWQTASGKLLVGSSSELGGELTWLESSKVDVNQRVAGKINARGEGFTQTSIWRNGSWRSLDELVVAQGWCNTRVLSINSVGQVLAIADTLDGSSADHIVILQPIEVAELSPKLVDKKGNEIEDSDKPELAPRLTRLVERDPLATPKIEDASSVRIAWREVKVKVGEVFAGKTVTWSMESLSPSGQGQNGDLLPSFRGRWGMAVSERHRHRFSASEAYNASFYEAGTTEDELGIEVTVTATTRVDEEGYTAIRVNVPPIGFNKAKIEIEVEGASGKMRIIDFIVPPVIVVDPGHGGIDSGAIGRTNASVLEKDLALAYSLSLDEEINDKFENENVECVTLLTRETTEEFPSLLARPNVAKRLGADIFLSIHFNASSADSNGNYARGSETFVERLASQASSGNPGANVNIEDDAILAGALNQCVVDAVVSQDLGGGHRPTFESNRVQIEGVTVLGVKQAGKAVTRDGEQYNGNVEHYSPVKACLIEVEFLSNEAALRSVDLSNASGIAIMEHFSESAASALFDNLKIQ